MVKEGDNVAVTGGVHVGHEGRVVAVHPKMCTVHLGAELGERRVMKASLSPLPKPAAKGKGESHAAAEPRSQEKTPPKSAQSVAYVPVTITRLPSVTTAPCSPILAHKTCHRSPATVNGTKRQLFSAPPPKPPQAGDVVCVLLGKYKGKVLKVASVGEKTCQLQLPDGSTTGNIAFDRVDRVSSGSADNGASFFPLAPTASHQGDVTQALLKADARLPACIPLVCTSFAAKDLASRSHPKAKAGGDPWSICDYLRDSLMWPSDAIFIDAEQFGMYAGPAKDDEKRIHYRDKGWRKSAVLANWYGVYQWAQRVSSAMIYFLSEEWYNSEACISERESIMQQLHGGDFRGSKLQVFLVLLDEVEGAGEFQHKIEQHGHKCHMYDLSAYMEWYNTWESDRKAGERLEGKLALRDFSNDLGELRDHLAELFGEGDRDELVRQAREAERQRATGRRDARRDDNGNPVRNRFLDGRRINVNQATADELMRAPHIGVERAQNIVDHRKKFGPFVTLYDLINVYSIGETILLQVMPFFAV